MTDSEFFSTCNLKPIKLETYRTNHHGDKFKNDPEEPQPEPMGSMSTGDFFSIFTSGDIKDEYKPHVRDPLVDFRIGEGIRDWWFGHATNLIQIGNKWTCTGNENCWNKWRCYIDKRKCTYLFFRSMRQFAKQNVYHQWKRRRTRCDWRTESDNTRANYTTNTANTTNTAASSEENEHRPLTQKAHWKQCIIQHNVISHFQFNTPHMCLCLSVQHRRLIRRSCFALWLFQRLC